MTEPVYDTTNPMFGNPASSSNEGTDYTQNFQVHYNGIENATGEELQLLETRAITAAGIPRINDTFRGNVSAFCKNISTAISTDQDSNLPSYIIVSCLFSTKASDTSDQEEDPLKKLPDIDWTPVFENEELVNCKQVESGGQILLAVNGGPDAQVNNFTIPIANSCADKFSPRPERQVPYMQLTIVQNLATFSPTEALAKIQKVNKDPFPVASVTLAKETALCTSRSASNQFQGGIQYWKVTTSFLVKTSHKLTLIDAGFNRYKNKSVLFQTSFNPDDKTEITVDNAPAANEQFLDANGNPSTTGAVFLDFTIFESTDFTTLGLPR